MIKVLDEVTINKIAAGEVIERPASALKELLENSSDSGALKIEIDFDQGGKKYLKVSDNGAGISADELDVAVERHATSKISQLEDLESLTTFGFRGEALSSLAAVSRFSLISTQASSKSGRKILVEGGKTSGSLPAPAIEGTTVIIEDLFFNVPARQKFLKSDGGETSALKKVIKQFALSHPQISITVRQSQKLLLHFPPQERLLRACKVLGLDQKEVVNVEAEDLNTGMKLQAVLAMPEASIATQSNLWFFVQGRPVSDRTMQYALIESYRHLLMNHQFPQAALWLTVDPKSVDVNVHPTKAQVKFLDNSSIFKFISHSVRDALEKNMAPQYLLSAPRVNLELTPEPEYRAQTPEFQPQLIHDHVVQYNQRVMNQVGIATPAGDSAEISSQIPHESYSPQTQLNSNSSAKVGVGPWSGLQLIGQLANTYLVCQAGTGLVMVDQHASHERVLFERIKKQFSENNIEKQMSLLEELVELDPEAVETLILPKNNELFLNLGFEFFQRGPTTIAVAARPAFLTDVGLKPLFERLTEQVSEWGDTKALKDLLGEIWSSMACHGAIRAGRVLSHEEMKALLKQMDEFSFSSFCPHGRPVSVKMSLTEIEKLFKRIV
jgi:DNA mismatch repair protein MutL